MGCNLTADQISRLMAECGKPGPDGTVNFRVFAQDASKIIHGMFSEAHDDPQFDWAQVDPQEVDDFLLQLFKEADKSGKGVLRMRDVKLQLLSIDMGAGHGLTDEEVQA